MREGESEKKHVMLQNIQDTTWNETSHPKLVHVYLFSSNHTSHSIKQGHPQNTVKPHFHSVSISIVIFHTAHRATGSSSLVVKAIQNFSLGLIEAGIINTIHNNTHVGARALPRTNAHQHTHTHTHTHTTRKGKDRL